VNSKKYFGLNLTSSDEKLERTKSDLRMAIPPRNGKTVLITGINGYIASVLGLALLEKGYSLRGTSRRIASTEPLLKGPYAPYADRIKIYEVPDMTVDGAFDEAVKGSSRSP
jgi:nucleoside-diphosphate-sugar epimerase